MDQPFRNMETIMSQRKNTSIRKGPVSSEALLRDSKIPVEKELTKKFSLVGDIYEIYTGSLESVPPTLPPPMLTLGRKGTFH